MSEAHGPAPGRAGPVLLALLLAAAVATAIWVYLSRTPDLALEAPRIERTIDPGAPGEAGRASIRFFVRFSDPQALVQVVGAERRPVRTLYRGPLEADRDYLCRWDGRDRDGEPVSQGQYRLRVLLPGEERDMVHPRRMRARPSGEADGEPIAVPCAPAGEEAA